MALVKEREERERGDHDTVKEQILKEYEPVT